MAATTFGTGTFWYIHLDAGLGRLLGERHDRVVAGMAHHGDAVGLDGDRLASCCTIFSDVQLEKTYSTCAPMSFAACLAPL